MSKRSDRIRAKRNRKRQKNIAQAKHRSHYVPPKPPTKFNYVYGADPLHAHGPLLVGSWGIPKSLADAMAKAGHKVPPRVRGVLLLDTGATSTCISTKAAQQLGLTVTRMQKAFGAGGQHDAPVFFANLEISITDQKTNLGTVFGWEQEVQGVPNLHECVQNLTFAGHPMEVIGLLGRDILRHAKIRYDGPAGSLSFEFDVASLQGSPSP